jgi:hypothetical protein
MNIPGNKRVLLADLSTIDADVGTQLWVEGVGKYEAVPRDQKASNAVDGPADALTPISWQPDGALVTLGDGSTVAASGIDTLQAGAGGRIAVDSLGQRFPRMSEFNKLISGSDHINIADKGMRAIMGADVFALRQQDRYIDTGTGQVRSRCWNDPDKYLIIGETGDACEQIWWTGGLGVKTAAGATSCVRIPNAYIDPDAAFSITFLIASLPGNTVSGRPMVMVGSQHGTTEQARAVIAQAGADNERSFWGTVNTGHILAGFVPHAYTISAKTGAGGDHAYYLNSAGGPVIYTAKVAGTIYADDHVIGGYWKDDTSEWISYKGFYVLAVVIGDHELTGEEILELHRALIDPMKVNGAISIGASNCNQVGGAVPDAPLMPDYRSAQNETSYGTQGIGWGPIRASEYFGQPLGHAADGYSVTQGIAPSLPGYVLLKCASSGRSLFQFYDWTSPYYDLLIEPLLRSCWQLGCCVDLKHIFIVSGENECDGANTVAATVTAWWAACAKAFRAGFYPIFWSNHAIRVSTVRLNNQFALKDPVATPTMRAGQTQFVAADWNARLVDVDAIPLGVDNTHYSANDRIRVGMLLGAAAIGV